MSKSPNIAIVDYGVSNLWSVLKAVQRFAPDAYVTEEKEKIATADAIILPGIGTFKAGMDGLRVRNLIEVIQDAAKKGVPILGICLGAQLLLEKGFEFGEHEGLGIIKGQVIHFPTLEPDIKIPAIGWQEVQPVDTEQAKTLFENLHNPFFYFVHSYVMQPSGSDVVLAKTKYGGYDYCAAIAQGNTFGTQFHPEKSGETGMKLIENFVRSIK